MFEEDDRVPPPQICTGDDLKKASVGELEERIEALRAEIARTEAELASKRAGRAAAEAVFGKG